MSYFLFVNQISILLINANNSSKWHSKLQIKFYKNGNLILIDFKQKDCDEKTLMKIWLMESAN